MASEIDVQVGNSKTNGACSACKPSSKALEDYRVWVVGLRGSEIRLCDGCAAELKDKLSVQFRAAAKA